VSIHYFARETQLGGWYVCEYELFNLFKTDDDGAHFVLNERIESICIGCQLRNCWRIKPVTEF
jgi:hypothetical protein